MKSAEFIYLALFLICTKAFGFWNLSNIKIRHQQALFNTKTPLVAGGKRFEADPGSPLMAVSETNTAS